jgi:hypothetical protein
MELHLPQFVGLHLVDRLKSSHRGAIVPDYRPDCRYLVGLVTLFKLPGLDRLIQEIHLGIVVVQVAI